MTHQLRNASWTFSHAHLWVYLEMCWESAGWSPLWLLLLLLSASSSSFPPPPPPAAPPNLFTLQGVSRCQLSPTHTQEWRYFSTLPLTLVPLLFSFWPCFFVTHSQCGSVNICQQLVLFGSLGPNNKKIPFFYCWCCCHCSCFIHLLLLTYLMSFSWRHFLHLQLSCG